jgi:hypothetical protein
VATLAEKVSTQGRRPLRWYNRRYLIAPRAQLTIIIALGACSLLASVVLCILSYRQVQEFGVLFNRSIVAPMAQPEVFAEMAQRLVWRMGIIIIIMLGYLVAAGILLTHRVTGPIFRLENDIRKFLGGENVPPISFRKRDEFQQLPPLVNKLMAGYNRKKDENS